MRILYNVQSMLVPPLTGVGQYALHLFEALRDDPGLGLEMAPFVHGHLQPPDAPLTPLPVPPPARHPRLRAAVARVPGARAFYAGLTALRGRPPKPKLEGDLYHEPNHVLEEIGDVPAVLTVHDLSVMRFPQWHPPDRLAAFRRGFEASVRRAAGVLTVSDFVRRELISLLGVPEARVWVTPLAAGPRFRPMEREEAGPTLDRLGLRWGEYVLFVGTREPRKNLGRLLDAWQGLPAGLRARRPLVLAGPAGWRMEALEARLDRAEGVHRLGYVPDNDRPALYAGAAGLAYPSLYEGFGLPPLEAAACGVPVLTSLGTPMADTLGKAALLVDPQDAAAIQDGLRRLLEDDALRAELRRTGPELAARHSWRCCAERTASAYRAAAGQAAPVG